MLLSLLVISSSDLRMRTIKLCSIVFGVTSKIPVINKIHWWVAFGCLFPAINKLRRYKCYNPTLPLKCWLHATVQWSMPNPDFSRKSRFLLQLGLRDPRRNAKTSGVEKLYNDVTSWCDVMVKKMKNMFIRLDRIHGRTWQTDEQRDTAWRHDALMRSIAR